MKFWNKQPVVRNNWTEVKTPGLFFHRAEVKRWCQSQESNGKFYSYYQDSWWFEREGDASMFILRWL